MKALNLLIQIALGVLIAVCFVAALIYFTDGQAIGLPMGLSSNLFGALSVCAGFAAVAIWVARKAFIQVKKRQIPDFELTKTTLLFLRKHHILLGWATIVAATAHGIYYLLRYPDRQGEIVTGLIAWTLLAVLLVFGVWLDYRIKIKVKSKPIRLYHITLAVGFLAAMLIHI